MKLALLVTALALAVSSTAALDCRCFSRCGHQSRQCYGQLQHKQQQCRQRCHNDWRCYRRCVDEWVQHCNHQRHECLSHCDDHRNNRCWHEITEPINVMPEEVEDEGQTEEQPATTTP